MASADSLRALAETDVAIPIPQEQLYATLQAPPFVFVPGTFNTRDVGLVPGTARVRRGFVFRSGGLDKLSDDGKALIGQKLGVKRVFDLRSQREHDVAADPEIDGVVNVWNADVGEQDAKVDLSTFVEGEGEKGYAGMYLEVLQLYQPAFRDVLEHVRDRPSEPFLFHCTGLLLTLAGESSDAIELDFLLSRVGTDPVREYLLAFVKRGAGVDSEDAPGFYNLVSLKAVYWRAFVEALDKEYGGFDGYITKTLGFSDEDLAKIKKNLVRDE